MKVATIKHHGHGGFPEVAQKDSERHRKAGAIVSSVEGAGLLSFFIKRNGLCKKLFAYMSFLK